MRDRIKKLENKAASLSYLLGFVMPWVYKHRENCLTECGEESLEFKEMEKKLDWVEAQIQEHIYGMKNEGTDETR